jgi:hypothetical protein
MRNLNALPPYPAQEQQLMLLGMTMAPTVAPVLEVDRTLLLSVMYGMETSI